MNRLEPRDLVVVGSGFASTFFLYGWLKKAGPDARALVLERGERRPHAWHRENEKRLLDEGAAAMLNRNPEKPWQFLLTFGGTSNSWFGCTPRMLPEDFELRTRYGRGEDWPVRYDELEPFYDDVERIMAIAGPSDDSPFPRSGPYPQPAHRMTDPDRLLQQGHPGRFFAMPSARARTTTPAGRAKCCANGICNVCPIDSKFTVLNEMGGVFDDPRVEVILGARALRVENAGGVARGVVFDRTDAPGVEELAPAEFVALGANAIFNPFLLLRSGLDTPATGRGLVEQVSVGSVAFLDGVDNFQGGTSLTGHGYMLYDGAHRKDRAAALMETMNIPRLRDERGRWRQVLWSRFIFEDLRQDGNRVMISSEDPDRPEVVFAGRSEYAAAGLASLEAAMPSVLAPLPVEGWKIFAETNKTEAHVLGTTPMGADPATSVVDGAQLHHVVRNLAVLGGSVFPTAAPANPTLTISALSLRAADRIFG